MKHRPNAELPACWQRPTADCQPTFFPQPVDALLADVRVTKDDLCRWKCLGWLSFDVDGVDTLDLPEEKEIRFVRHLVMAGLGNSEIERLLNDSRRVVIIEFPSFERAQAFYQSEEYQRAKKLREGAAIGTFIVVEGCVPNV
jgi:hypothetical protein